MQMESLSGRAVPLKKKTQHPACNFSMICKSVIGWMVSDYAVYNTRKWNAREAMPGSQPRVPSTAVTSRIGTYRQASQFPHSSDSMLEQQKVFMSIPASTTGIAGELGGMLPLDLAAAS